MYWPAKTNLTQLNVTVEKLNPSTLYKFIIYSKNIYNDRINKSKWAYSEKSVKTEGKCFYYFSKIPFSSYALMNAEISKQFAQ